MGQMTPQGGFSQLAEAQEKLSERVFRQHMWYWGDKELIHNGGKTYALRGPWAKKAFVAMNTLKENFPDAQIDYWESQK